MPTQFQKNPYVSCPYFYRETSIDIKCKDRGELAGGAGLVGERPYRASQARQTRWSICEISANPATRDVRSTERSKI